MCHNPKKNRSNSSPRRKYLGNNKKVRNTRPSSRSNRLNVVKNKDVTNDVIFDQILDAIRFKHNTVFKTPTYFNGLSNIEKENKIKEFLTFLNDVKCESYTYSQNNYSDRLLDVITAPYMKKFKSLMVKAFVTDCDEFVFDQKKIFLSYISDNLKIYNKKFGIKEYYSLEFPDEADFNTLFSTIINSICCSGSFNEESNTFEIAHAALINVIRTPLMMFFSQSILNNMFIKHDTYYDKYHAVDYLNTLIESTVFPGEFDMSVHSKLIISVSNFELIIEQCLINSGIMTFKAGKTKLNSKMLIIKIHPGIVKSLNSYPPSKQVGNDFVASEDNPIGKKNMFGKFVSLVHSSPLTPIEPTIKNTVLNDLNKFQSQCFRISSSGVDIYKDLYEGENNHFFDNFKLLTNNEIMALGRQLDDLEVDLPTEQQWKSFNSSYDKGLVEILKDWSSDNKRMRIEVDKYIEKSKSPLSAEDIEKYTKKLKRKLVPLQKRKLEFRQELYDDLEISSHQLLLLKVKKKIKESLIADNCKHKTVRLNLLYAELFVGFDVYYDLFLDMRGRIYSESNFIAVLNGMFKFLIYPVNNDTLSLKGRIMFIYTFVFSLFDGKIKDVGFLKKVTNINFPYLDVPNTVLIENLNGMIEYTRTLQKEPVSVHSILMSRYISDVLDGVPCRIEMFMAIDQKCSGATFLAIILKNNLLQQYTNLFGGSFDIYLLVMGFCKVWFEKTKLELGLSVETIFRFEKIISSRAIIKYIFMVMLYGEGAGSRYKSIVEKMVELKFDLMWLSSDEFVNVLTIFCLNFSNIVDENLNNLSVDMHKFGNFYKEMFKTTKLEKVVIKTLDGCVFRYCYKYITNTPRVYLRNPVTKKKFQHRLYGIDNEYVTNTRMIAQSFLANYTHSVDSSAMRCVIYRYYIKTGSPLMCLHDCVLTHFNNVHLMYDVLNEVYEFDLSNIDFVPEQLFNPIKILLNDDQIKKMEGKLSGFSGFSNTPWVYSEPISHLLYKIECD